VNRERTDRIVDILSVVLISAAAVLTAFCGYQSGKWTGVQTMLYNQASVQRTQATEANADALQAQVIDIGIFLRYIEALHHKDTEAAAFFKARFRPQARPALDAWLRMRPLENKSAPSSPFVMQEYRRAVFGEPQHLNQLAAVAFTSAEAAERTAEAYLLLTVIFAGVSFMAGISTKLRYPLHMIIVAVGAIALLYGTIRLASLPFG